ncbi:hypothetical protein AEP_00650 [Curvibacter sp. AEP1-3]|uniref:hypothetical protein n=1 Tax=Curvibacter sp. AEP1-3 TaxID=1844971 RepID=UPI000B3C3CB3|nr:hypothetical protein [Curvibacter sp. AEP1-3]ARV17610.1 hypothetical protein AEP_00650 [Curvibacter sp. AEP1-3]
MTIDAEKLANLYVKVLDDIGLKSEIDGDNDVVFRYPEMGTLYFSLDSNDPEFMRLVFPNFADQDLTGGDLPKLLSLINEVNRKNKAVKLYVRSGDDGESNVSAAIECFVAGHQEAPTQDHLNAIFKRCMNAMRAGIQTLVKTSQEDSF